MVDTMTNTAKGARCPRKNERWTGQDTRGTRRALGSEPATGCPSDESKRSTNRYRMASMAQPPKRSVSLTPIGEELREVLPVRGDKALEARDAESLARLKAVSQAIANQALCGLTPPPGYLELLQNYVDGRLSWEELRAAGTVKEGLADNHER